jgi:hypothetical protein
MRTKAEGRLGSADEEKRGVIAMAKLMRLRNWHLNVWWNPNGKDMLGYTARLEDRDGSLMPPSVEDWPLLAAFDTSVGKALNGLAVACARYMDFLTKNDREGQPGE